MPSKKPASASEQPLPPWQPLPLGSAGDAFDGAVAVRSGLAPRPGRSRAARRSSTTADPALAPQTPHLAILALCLVALAVFSIGPASGFRGIFASGAVVSAAAALGVFLIDRRPLSGAGAAWGALAGGLLLLAVDIAAPRGFGPTPMPRGLGVAVAGAPRDAALALVEQDMLLVARAARLGHAAFGPRLLTTGSGSINRTTSPLSEYRLALTFSADLAPVDDFERDRIFFTPRRKLRDPFADDRNATYGVAVLDRYIVVFSMGPDGRWSIDPTWPAPRDLEDPDQHFAPHRFDPATGRGDIIAVFPLEAMDTFDLPEALDAELEARMR